MFQKQDTLKITDFDAIRLRIASPDTIRSWSHGEIEKPETINYRTQKPEKGGLFAEEIFGPSKDWECYCGKYKKIRFKGIVCDKCGVEVTHSIVRRERMGHIELAAPVSHIWFLRGVPSKIGTVLDLSVQSLEKVIYFASFIVTDVNEEAKVLTQEQVKQEYKSKQKMIEGEFKRDVERLNAKFEGDEKKIKAELKHLEEIRDHKVEELEEDFTMVDKELKELKPLKIISEETFHDWSLKYGHIFEAGIGAEAVQEMLRRTNLEATMAQIEESMVDAPTAKRDRLMRRLKLLKSLHINKLEPWWMMLGAIPVIPPDLRPMVALDGGRFATSDLNDLYRRVINRNNRLKRLKELNAPEVISRNEKRMLQEAVDALIDNSARSSKTVIAATGKKRQLKSLADQLKGKQGRFRQNLLGKRIDYSGRSVIVVGPNLRLDQCGIPKKMALELFRPFIIAKLIDREFVHNIRSANRFIETDRAEVWDILEEITKDAFVLLNRAPTLHRLGIQAFRPVLIEGKAIQIHPLVCEAYNADFDGDQMAVHVPLTEEAKREAAELMLATKNLLKPAHGGPVATPGKDIAWGIFSITLTSTEPDTKNMKLFATETDALYAQQTGGVGMREWVRVRLDNGVIVETTPGRLIANQLFPEEVPFMNQTMGKKELSNIVKFTLEKHGSEFTAGLLDRLKVAGFKYSTATGYSWGMSNLPEIPEKEALIQEGNQRVLEVDSYFSQGLLTASERHEAIIKVWNEIKDRIAEFAKKSLPKDNPAYTMIESGARGSWGQMTQMIGMKGLVANPSGDIIELPVKSSFKDGYDVLEFFISSHGTRKGLTDTALRTANAGYLTRRLVDVSQDVVVREEDCGDDVGVVLTKAESDEIGEPLLVRILGRIVLSDVKKPGGRKIIVPAGELITEQHIRDLEEVGEDLEEAHVRSVMTCRLFRGVCQKCYGYDLAYNKLVKTGTSVGIMAAQSIGEPGTQLTMRTFHTGGVAGKDITQGLPRVEELFEARPPKQKAIMAEVSGKITVETAPREIVQAVTGKQIMDTRPGQKTVRIEHDSTDEQSYVVGKDPDLKVKDGGKVKIGQVIATKKNGTEVVSEYDGIVALKKVGVVTVVYETPKLREYIIPPGYTLYVKDGDEVTAGDALTDGNMDLQLLYKHKGKEAVQRYLSKEIQFIYASQGQKVNNKHIEIIIKQMFSRVRVSDPGDTDLLPGEIVEKATWMEANEDEEVANKAVAEELFLGITKISLSTDSWLSAASFQETARVLINAACTGKVDNLIGLKENVIIGRLIPAGTGFGVEHKVDLEPIAMPVTDRE
ncbi:DNA-directed RNA polymerase subunit beta' [Candidatus Uhrbacteria bacterium RIFOXYB12_FULL_58_10]|uniref:DNA-directed RNA polymerase subunit beta' n=1 Tax=Candidatus Uhrbacteria bacterium RIFOXYB2_FULL_57_15 TaxID=1802422 RepID=A0A1F7W6R2_9BACT|nr:MAG: DNA-directed RNA polymerase subunit beta' [Candidatus Uhrbacteria bacterium RIFOXYB12_FULL_58_10]OGL97897.1 MAG: DNA-directed RNA polymerase subunit beta' [Candidatus Uhrbacteria bacterium RIFOXYB2_FULL_57_15]OGL98918.1 MAG: DNA-directed RNA polymerase subunit beta' [Candidatus Uhrbacteria bacterium RIFOXYC12_FULL_57_11]